MAPTVPAAQSRNFPSVFLEFDLDQEARSFMGVGESHIESFLAPDFTALRAAYPTISWEWATFGMSSTRSVTWMAVADQFIKAGLKCTDVVIQSHSTNDQIFDQPNGGVSGLADAWGFLGPMYDALKQRIEEYQALGKKVWIITMFYGLGSDNGGNLINPSLYRFLADCRTLAARTGAGIIDLAATWDAPIHMAGDHTHPSEAGKQLFRDVFTAAITKGM